MEHPRHGAGVVTELMADGRTRVAYDNGEEHRYKPSSMHKLMRGDSPDGAMAALSSFATATATAFVTATSTAFVRDLLDQNEEFPHVDPDNPDQQRYARLLQRCWRGRGFRITLSRLLTQVRPRPGGGGGGGP